MTRAEALKRLERVFNEGTKIIEQGTRREYFYILKSGWLEVLIDGRKVAEIDTPGSSFGEIAALAGEPRTADVVAAGRVVCYEIETQHLEELLSVFPRLVRRIIDSLIQAVKRVNEKYLRESKSWVDERHRCQERRKRLLRWSRLAHRYILQAAPALEGAVAGGSQPLLCQLLEFHRTNPFPEG
jgi:CRP-like cAMP-binding protein